ncbi:hypothetical protein BD779DRAFT_1472808 [Infundibulicybe gibba]|nr:hypothetical protein BD779DRAFT_1472808 [Infundibulicybe gibba]
MSKCCGGAYSRHEWSRNTNLSGGERLENIARDGKMRGTGVPPGGLGSEQRSTAVPVGSFPFAVHTSPPSVYPWNAKANNDREEEWEDHRDRDWEHGKGSNEKTVAHDTITDPTTTKPTSGGLRGTMGANGIVKGRGTRSILGTGMGTVHQNARTAGRLPALGPG